jgi:hypothetical protein
MLMYACLRCVFMLAYSRQRIGMQEHWHACVNAFVSAQTLRGVLFSTARS